MKTWQPWTITDGTLQLTEWPDHGPGVVVVEGDVFESWEGQPADRYGQWIIRVNHSEHWPGLMPCNLRGGNDAATVADCLQALFAHIDAHPQTHYVLRTLHPERVRECWPKNTNCVCPGSSLAPGAECDHHPSCPARGYHRDNVTLSIGPLATQADADRLVDLCGNVELNAPATPGEGES